MAIAESTSARGLNRQLSQVENTGNHLIDEQDFGDLPWENLTQLTSSAGIATSASAFSKSFYADFFETLFRGLHRSEPRHVIILHERGVAEKAALFELACRAMRGSPAFLGGKQIIAINCKRISPEGIRPFLDSMLRIARKSDQAVICLEGFASLLRQHPQADVRVILASLLNRVRCRILGLMHPHEFEEWVAADADLRELFTFVHLPEPEPGVAFDLVRHYAAGLTAQYRVQIGDEAIQRAVALTASHILHERLPLKAVKVLRAVCDDVEYERMERHSLRDRITEEDIVGKVAQFTGVPAETLAGIGEGVDYKTEFSELVVGQEHAVDEVATELGLIKAGFVDSGKPASVMMFIGQTGTGKTELAKVLARFYSSSKRLKTFTLGNFSEPHSVSGIIGVPPGYMGHEQGGRLVNELNAEPYGVFLLDEADKAHPDVMQPFLNLFDEGWICDQRGVKAYADRAIFILTTNVGQRQIGDMCKAGKSIEEITATMKESLSRIRHTKSNRPVFTPEFLARVKRFVVFRSLDAEAMTGIGRRLVSDLQREWLVKRQKKLVVSSAITNAIAQRAYTMDQKAQGKEGGRIVRKLLVDMVDSTIQNAISTNTSEYRSCRSVELSLSEVIKGDPLNLTPDRIQIQFM